MDHEPRPIARAVRGSKHDEAHMHMCHRRAPRNWWPTQVRSMTSLATSRTQVPRSQFEDASLMAWDIGCIMGLGPPHMQLEVWVIGTHTVGECRGFLRDCMSGRGGKHRRTLTGHPLTPAAPQLSSLGLRVSNILAFRDRGQGKWRKKKEGQYQRGPLVAVSCSNGRQLQLINAELRKYARTRADPRCAPGGPQAAPRWPPGGPQVAPRWAPGAPQVGPRWAPGGAQVEPRWNLGGLQVDPKWTPSAP